MTTDPSPALLAALLIRVEPAPGRHSTDRETALIPVVPAAPAASVSPVPEVIDMSHVRHVRHGQPDFAPRPGHAPPAHSHRDSPRSGIDPIAVFAAVLLVLITVGIVLTAYVVTSGYTATVSMNVTRVAPVAADTTLFARELDA